MGCGWCGAIANGAIWRNEHVIALMQINHDAGVVWKLLQAGADPYAKGKYGRTVFDRAETDSGLKTRAALIKSWLEKRAR